MLTPHGEIPDRLASGMSMDEQHDWLAVRASRRTVLRGLLLAGVSASPLFWQQTARAAPDVRVASRLLVPGADPRREMTVGIAVPDAFRSGRVEAASAAGDSGGTAALELQPVRGSSMRYARARLTGLQSGTKYAYTAVLDGVAASSGTFRTAPEGAADFTFTAFGDQGTGSLSRSMLRQLAAVEPDLHLVAGDISYANQEGTGGPGDFHPALWDAWLSENDVVSKSVPFLCVLGNHEMEPGFATHGYAGVLGRLPLPGRSALRCPASWELRYGTVGFVGLDSNDVSYELARNHGYTRGAQQAWLRSVLQGFRRPESGVEFIVVVLHHSPYSTNRAHGSEGGVRDAWVPLFDQYGVDLVIAGHNHCYERTLPLRGGTVVGHDAGLADSTAGTTYVTAGGGGATATPEFIREGETRVFTAAGQQVESIDWSLPGRTGEHAFLIVDVHPGGRPGATSRMTLRAVDRNGEILDTVELSRPATVLAPAGTGGSRWPSTDTLMVAGAAATAAVAGGVGGGLLLRRRRHRVDSKDQASWQGPSKVVVRPLLERGIDSSTVVLRRPTVQPDTSTAPPGPAWQRGPGAEADGISRSGEDTGQEVPTRLAPGRDRFPERGTAAGTGSPPDAGHGVTSGRPAGNGVRGPAAGEIPTGSRPGSGSGRAIDRRGETDRNGGPALQPSGDVAPATGAVEEPRPHLPPRAPEDHSADPPVEGGGRGLRPVSGPVPEADAGADLTNLVYIDDETVVVRRPTWPSSGLPGTSLPSTADRGRVNDDRQADRRSEASHDGQADHDRRADDDGGWFERRDQGHPSSADG